MSTDPDSLSTPSSEDPSAAWNLNQRPLHRHRLRDAWGHGVLVWERNDKRAYQFEDGELRVFKDGFFHLMQEVDLPLDQARPVLASLDRILGRQQAVRRSGQKKEQVLSFDDQLTLFRLLFPDGFQGEGWITKVRGEDTGKVLKRFRAPAIQKAGEELSAEGLQKLLDGKKYDAVLEAVLKVLGGTSLVRPSSLALLRGLDESQRKSFAEALHGVLHGEEDFEQRLQVYLQQIHGSDWQLATSLPALVDPQNQICVVPARFRQQALWMAPRMRYTDRPEVGAYMRYLEMAQAVRERLEQADLQPRDLMDVHDFICVTLQPSARKLLDQHTADQAA